MNMPKIFMIMLLIICIAGRSFSEAARVAVVSPSMPDVLSKGEVGVMLDAVAKVFDKSKQFESINKTELLNALKEQGLERSQTCPNKLCFGSIAEALSLDYIVSLTIEKKNEPFETKLEIFEMPSTKRNGEVVGEFDGVKSQLSLKYLPKQAKELVSMTEGKAASKEKVALKPAAKSQQSKKSAAQPQPAKPEPAGKKLVKSPGFWIPTVLAVAVPVAIIYYMRTTREETKNGEEQQDAGNEVPFPDTPSRPAITRSP